MALADARGSEVEARRGPRWRTGIVLLAMLALGGSVITTGAGSADPAAAADADTLRILVTNDDGVDAPGISALVNGLQNVPNAEVHVIAPATNQSGTGGNFTTGNITVAPATTAAGDAATKVSGFPADTVLYGVLTALPQRPHVVVSGINLGQNLGNFTELSGTVGAARTANRLGLPAIAVSTSISPSPNYFGGAVMARALVETLRSSYVAGTAPAQTINVNVPTCPSGTIRELVVVPLGRTSDVGGYTVQSGSVGNGVFAPTIVNQNGLATANCNSTLTNPRNDIEAFNNGFLPVTVLNPDYTDR